MAAAQNGAGGGARARARSLRCSRAHLGDDEEEHDRQRSAIERAVGPRQHRDDVVADDERRAHLLVVDAVECIVHHVAARDTDRAQRVGVAVDVEFLCHVQSTSYGTIVVEGVLLVRRVRCSVPPGH